MAYKNRNQRFLDFFLVGPLGKRSHEVCALVDTGSVISCISKNEYDKLVKQGYSFSVRNSDNLKVGSCVGGANQTCGLAKLKLYFPNIIDIYFVLEVLIVPELAQKFILGDDFFTNEAIIMLTKDFVHVKVSRSQILSIAFKHVPML